MGIGHIRCAGCRGGWSSICCLLLEGIVLGSQGRHALVVCSASAEAGSARCNRPHGAPGVTEVRWVRRQGLTRS